MNLIQALANYERVAAKSLPYGWFAYDEDGILYRFGISGVKSTCICNRSMLEREDYIEYKPTLKIVSEEK